MAQVIRRHEQGSPSARFRDHADHVGEGIGECSRLDRTAGDRNPQISPDPAKIAQLQIDDVVAMFSCHGAELAQQRTAADAEITGDAKPGRLVPGFLLQEMFQ
ncbi:hypothetical protein [Streptomyces sp. NBC_00391]|uniref:hypothetical protein n=1 Tax=Streptomyces sp. NBC_00391 TaxID=2903647 RepID=UPI002E2066FB